MSKIIERAMKLIPKERSSTIDGLITMIEELAEENEQLKKAVSSDYIGLVMIEEVRCFKCTKILSDIEQTVKTCAYCGRES